jgi:hypothetical protein
MARARTLRRKHQREHIKLVRQREHLARLEPGGSAENPLEIASASLVEVSARAQLCLLCDGPVRVDEHAAVAIDGVRLRVARVVCTRCGNERRIFFRLVSPLPN